MNTAAAILLAATSAAAITVNAQTAPDPRVRPDSRMHDCTAAGCHAQELDHKFQHGPAAVGACDACHQAADVQAHTFSIRAQGKDLCVFCHISKAGDAGPVAHEPFAKGDCTSCHNPHGGQSRFLLAKGDTNTQCLSCHDVLAGHKNVHQAITDTSCTACHKAHAADHAKLLVKEPRSLCLTCHDTVQHQLSSSTTAHEPAKGDCLQCHTAHASSTVSQLKLPPADLCISCHEEVGHAATSALHPHSIVLDGQACLNCHTAHASSHANLFRDAPVETCLACHKHPVQAAAKKNDAPGKPVFRADVIAAAAQAAANPPPPPTKPAPPVADLSPHHTNPHGPVAAGRCDACHDVHGGSKPRLLTANYAQDFYLPFSTDNFALCFTCHDQGLAEAPAPAAPMLTNFRDDATGQNLHFLHVNKEQGRSCRACHTVHASKFESQIRETVTYGNWELPIGFKPSLEGGSCAPGCHKPQTYTRAPVEIPVKPLPAKPPR
jgi:predicted CXXCH cytochrome family protein